jgi:ribA/ribD-fused uncharacterized protein
MRVLDPQRYQRADCALIYRAREEFGALGNMAGGYPISLAALGTAWTSEALFQALRFPDHPDIQKEILDQKSGYGAKCKSKKDGRRDRLSRPDWPAVCVDIMEFCVRAKFVQNRVKLEPILPSTQDRPIVELTRTVAGQMWGAAPCKENPEILVGRNHLGSIWMEIREQLRKKDMATFGDVCPPSGLILRLLGEEIKIVKAIPDQRP